jgi:hypothetical protein
MISLGGPPRTIYSWLRKRPMSEGNTMTLGCDVLRFAAQIIALGALCAGTPACAEVRFIDGGAGVITLEAHNATVREVLEALSDSRTIQFRTSEALSQVVTGTYSGTLPRVLARILNGYDYVIQSTPSGLRLSVLSVGQPVNAGTTANAVTNVSNASGQRVSTNVDLDEEIARGPVRASRPVQTAVPPAPRITAPSVSAVPTSARVSSNLDAD